MTQLIELITSTVEPEPVPVTHDWTLTIGEWRFGIEELDWTSGRAQPIDGLSSSSIYLGSIEVDTEMPALGVLGLGIILLLAVIGFGIFGTRARRSPM